MILLFLIYVTYYSQHNNLLSCRILVMSRTKNYGKNAIKRGSPYFGRGKNSEVTELLNRREIYSGHLIGI